MRLDIHVFHHVVPDEKILAAVRKLTKEVETMSEALKTAVDQLVAETQDSKGKLDSITTFIQGVPALVATAVTAALEAANVDEADAVGIIDQATQTISDSVDSALAAINANPAPGEGGSGQGQPAGDPDGGAPAPSDIPSGDSGIGGGEPVEEPEPEEDTGDPTA